VGQLLRPATSRATSRPLDRRQFDTITGVVWALTRAARYGVFRPKCLVRSMALERMLRRHGFEGGEIHIGVRLEEGDLKAHAWVEWDGRILGDDPRHVRTFVPATDLRLVEL